MNKRHHPVLDGFIYALSFLIAALLLTGGAYYSTPHMKLELSEVDAFAWALLLFVAIRYRRSGSWFPPRMQGWIERTMHFLTGYTGWILFGVIAVYVGIHTWILQWRFDSFHANAFDMGFVDQALWSTTRVGFLHATIASGHTYLGEHFSPILGAVALIYRVWDSPTAMFLFQSMTLASGAVLVYFLARSKRVDARAVIVLPLCFLLYHPLRAANGFDFREDNLFVPIFLGALLSAQNRKWVIFWILMLVSWTVKENAEIFTAFIGLWLVLRREDKQKAQGLTLFLLSIAAFYFINTKVTGYFSGGAAHTVAAHRLRVLGANSAQIMASILHHPLHSFALISHPLFQKGTLRYFFNVTVPFIWFALAAPFVFLIAVSGIIMNALVNSPTIGFHYECILLPFLFYVLVEGVRKSQDRGMMRTPQSMAVLLLSFLLFFGRSPVDTLRRMHPNAHDRLLSKTLTMIPAQASVSAQSPIQPHLTHRKDAYLLPHKINTVDYIVADLSGQISQYADPDLRAWLGRIDQNKYEKIFNRDQIEIWKRKKPLH